MPRESLGGLDPFSTRGVYSLSRLRQESQISLRALKDNFQGRLQDEVDVEDSNKQDKMMRHSRVDVEDSK